MKILKYKKINNNKYLVEFDSGGLELYEEVILSFELLLKKNIEEAEYRALLLENLYYKCYYQALKYIRIRSRSLCEVKDKLIHDGMSEEHVSKVIDKLLEQGYLNDSSYANSFVNKQLLTTTRGPKKIYQELQKKGVEDAVILEALELYDYTQQLEKVRKIVFKMVSSNHSKSNSFLRKKIYNSLSLEGFSKEVIDRVLDEVDFSSDEDIKERELLRLRRKLSRKYEGEELEKKLREQMIRKGFYS